MQRTVLVVIPCRYDSTRLPGKPLISLRGKPLIQHVYEGVIQSQRVNRVVIATDSEKIRKTAEAFDAEVVMTRPDHPTGTDRAREVASGFKDYEWIVNVQGDEPFVNGDAIDTLLNPFSHHPDLGMTTLKTKITDPRDRENPHIVKVVTDRAGFALYFSRSPLPYVRGSRGSSQEAYKHIGLYAFRRDFLLKFGDLPRGPLEQSESLEQLRALENGRRLYVAETSLETVDVNTKEDLARAETLLRLCLI